MNRIFYLIASYIAFFLFFTFIFENITANEIKSSYIFLFLFYFFSLPSFFLNKQLVKNKTNFSIFAFIIYVVVMLFVDSHDLDRIKQLTIGTTGGFILYFSTGMFVASNIITINKSRLKIFLILKILLICYYTVLFLDIYSQKGANLRADLFLVADVDEHYQRVGNIFFISYMLISIFIVLTINRLFEMRYVFFKYLILLYYLSLTLLIALFGQMIGSNSLFVSVLCYGFSIVMITIYLNDVVKNSINLKIILSSVLCIFVIYVYHENILSLLNIDKYTLRFFGFGTGSYDSFESRFQIFTNNFWIHFSFDPLFGNMIVEEHTTGTGTYIHSLISLLTHTGIIGSMLFILYIRNLFKKYANTSLLITKLYLLTLSIVLCLTLFSAFFLWMPLWFVLGFFVFIYDENVPHFKINNHSHY